MTQVERSRMEELAGRVEAASGPDRELDADIALAAGIVRERDGLIFFGHRDHSVMVLERGYYDHEGSAPELPHFTSSLDAAMQLVLEGSYWSCGRDREGAFAWVSRGETRAIVKFYSAATPALALLAACLKARALGEG